MTSSPPTVAVLGLGYVGLPLALAFAEKYKTIGYDRSETKIADYKNEKDPMGESSPSAFAAARADITFTTDPSALTQADMIIIAVPTPVDSAHNPDFSSLISASETVGKHMKSGATVVYESTVYPGATEEICVPLLEKHSDKTWKKDFFVGYSPERINPGDKERTLKTIIKVVSGDTPDTLNRVADLYGAIITAGIHRAPSIKVAEAAKVIENTQRDLNIALMNELAIIFHKLDIDTMDVLNAAGTKWNFLPFRPGLVGGHCIGVDPYYLTHKAEMMGYHPQVILAGRRINDGMAAYVAEQTIKQMIKADIPIKGTRVNVLGLTFKENCPDLRNSKVADLIFALRDYGCDVYVHDLLADPGEAMHEYGIALTKWEDMAPAQVCVLAVAHEFYKLNKVDVLGKTLNKGLFVKIKPIEIQPTNNNIKIWVL